MDGRAVRQLTNFAIRVGKNMQLGAAGPVRREEQLFPAVRERVLQEVGGVRYGRATGHLADQSSRCRIYKTEVFVHEATGGV